MNGDEYFLDLDLIEMLKPGYEPYVKDKLLQVCEGEILSTTEEKNIRTSNSIPPFSTQQEENRHIGENQGTLEAVQGNIHREVKREYQERLNQHILGHITEEATLVSDYEWPQTQPFHMSFGQVSYCSPKCLVYSL